MLTEDTVLVPVVGTSWSGCRCHLLSAGCRGA